MRPGLRWSRLGDVMGRRYHPLRPLAAVHVALSHIRSLARDEPHHFIRQLARDPGEGDFRIEIGQRAEGLRIKGDAENVIGPRHGGPRRFGRRNRDHGTQMIACLADPLGDTGELQPACAIHAVVAGAVFAVDGTDVRIDAQGPEDRCQSARKLPVAFEHMGAGLGMWRYEVDDEGGLVIDGELTAGPAFDGREAQIAHGTGCHGIAFERGVARRKGRGGPRPVDAQETGRPRAKAVQGLAHDLNIVLSRQRRRSVLPVAGEERYGTTEGPVHAAGAALPAQP